MARKIRDTQQQRLYAAEKILQGRSQRYETVAELQAYVDSVVSSRWFQNRYPHITKIHVTDGRSRRSACAVPELREIRMPVWSRFTYVILHEIAHITSDREQNLNKEAWHGRAFARHFLAMVEQFMGKEDARLLRTKFREHRIKWAKTRPGFRPAHVLGSPS